MGHAELVQQLRDVDYFLLREYCTLKAIIEKFPLEENGIAEIRIQLNALGPQRERLKTCIDLIERRKLPESQQEITTELEVVRQFFDIEIRYARKRMPAILNPDDKRVSDYVRNLSKLIKVYDVVVEPPNQIAGD